MAFPVYRQVGSNTLQLRPSQTKIVCPFPDYLPANSDSQAAIDAINALVHWTDTPPIVALLPDNSISLAKLVPATPGTVLLANSTSGIQAISFAGDVTVTSAGTTAIASKVIVNDDISDSAGIAVTKLAASTISGITLGGTLGTLTFSNAGNGGSSGTTYTGATGATISYNTIGAAATNQTMHIGTTAIAINRGSASQTLTGVSIDGNAGYATSAGNADTVDGYHASGLVQTTYNSSLNSDSRNSRGVTRLYRRDSDSDYSVQTYWTGAYWRLYGYVGDSGHADTYVGYADGAGSVGGLSVHSGRNNEANKIVRTDGNGYLLTGYINSSNGNENNASNPPRVWGTNGSDDYMRTYQTGSLSVGYASSAGTLQTSRTIWGQSFNGGSNISGNLTGVGSIVLSAAGGILTPGSAAWILYWDNVASVGFGTSSPQSGYNWTFGQSVYVNGAIAASGSKTFDIPHPHRPQSRLRYAAVESPRIDLIHRGTATVCDGWCRIDLDAYAGLTTGTVASLMRDMQALVTKTAPTRGNLWAYVEGTTLVIQSDEPHETHQVSWLVIGERCDRTIQTSRVTDSTGRLIVEYPENA